MPEPRRVDKPLVLYGMGNLGRLSKEIFDELGIPIYGFHNKDSQWDYRYKDQKLLAICVAIEPYESVIKPLKEAGWTDLVPVWDIIEAYPEVGIHNGWFVGKVTEKDNEGLVRSMFDDIASISHHYNFYAWRKYRNELPVLFEVTKKPCLPSTLKDIRARQKVMKYRGEPEFSIHAEGFELQTINENMDLFKKHRPTLEVACYHSRDGLWKIEKALMDNLEDYEFTFRLYAYMGQSSYLYCTPKEKV